MDANSRRVLICGDRNWENFHRVYHVVRLAHQRRPIDVIIEGGARGADLIGARAATEHRINVIRFAADWEKEGKAAGVIRNQRMLDEGKPTEVWAFHNDLEHSKGTKDMVQRALKAGIKTVLITDQKSMVLKSKTKQSLEFPTT